MINNLRDYERCNTNLGEDLEATLTPGGSLASLTRCPVRDRAELLSLIDALGYNNFENFFDDNPGAIEGVVEFIAGYSRAYCTRLRGHQDDIADWIEEQTT
tara:strand:- start:729 stop:1031 length:303 start_codon:yes stop_codon:yes gene_type:complete